ncbi:hypothetical protein [Pseudomonas phage vB_Pa-PAC2]
MRDGVSRLVLLTMRYAVLLCVFIIRKTMHAVN